ncbi:MAG: transcription antitermination factor NusB [Dehalococcoidia bacterium]
MAKVNPADLRRRARMVALQALFAVDVRGSLEEISLEWLTEEDPLPVSGVAFCQTLLEGVKEHQPSLDAVIEKYAPAWPVALLSIVDRNILRIALFELLCDINTPPKTAVNEAVEVAKVFGSDSSARFVNGVLGTVMTALESGELTLVQPVSEGR